MSGRQVPDLFEILAFNGDQQADAVLRWEGENYDFTVTADGPWGHVTGRADDCFEALTRVREQIEPQGWLLGVNGSRRDTWPSGMCRDTGVSSSTGSGPAFAPPAPIASRPSTPHPARRCPLSPSRSPSKSSGASRCDHPGRPCPRRSPGHRGSARPGRTAARRLRVCDRPVLRPQRRRPPYGIVGGWSVDSFGQLVSFTHNQNYRPSPTALEFPPPVTALDAALQRAVTGYGSEQELLAAFRDATLLLFAQEGQTGLYTVVEDDGSRYIPAFTHPTHTPDTWHQWQQTTGHHLAATGLPVRLNPGHRISLTIPGEAGNQAGGENAGPTPDDNRDPAPSPRSSWLTSPRADDPRCTHGWSAPTRSPASTHLTPSTARFSTRRWSCSCSIAKECTRALWPPGCGPRRNRGCP